MATILNNPSNAPATERTYVERSSDDSGGWAVAIIVLLAVLAIGAFMWLRYYNAPAAATPQSNGGANINVTLPESQTQQPQGATTQQQSPAPSTGNPGAIPAQ
jgi:hypothetical protein